MIITFPRMSDDELFAEPPVDDGEPKKKRRKKRKRGRVLTVEDIPRKVREEFRTDQKVRLFCRSNNLELYFSRPKSSFDYWADKNLKMFTLPYPGCDVVKRVNLPR